MFLRNSTVIFSMVFSSVAFAADGDVTAPLPHDGIDVIQIRTSQAKAARKPPRRIPASQEEWKGPRRDPLVGFGVQWGMGIFDDSVGFIVLPHFSRMIFPKGFIEDISNEVFAELQAGPLFVKSETVFAYSLHMRWDFNRNNIWTYYALGGLGGMIVPDELGDSWRHYVRLGVGALWRPVHAFDVRFEASHEWITVGMNWEL